MHRVIDVDLEGQAKPFRLHEDAYEALGSYLDRARAGVPDAADESEVIGDLERSIGMKLAERQGATDRVLSLADVDSVLAAIGPVGADEKTRGFGPIGGSRTPRRRRLFRIRAGQQIAGVCRGLAAYSEIDVAWVRTIFVLGTVFTAGFGLLVYLALAFILPVVPSHEAWVAAMNETA